MRIVVAIAIVALAFGLPVDCLAEPGKSVSEPAKDAPQPAVASAGGLAADLETSDAAEPFVPARPRTEEDENRIDALSFFAAGRVSEQEDHTLEALRHYQRASRYDPSSRVARRQAVMLAMRLERWSDAVRYAGRGDLDIDEASILLELGRHCLEEEKYGDAARHFRTARSLHAERTAPYVLLTREIGRSAFLAEEFAESAEAFAELMDALEHGEQHGLDERTRRYILADNDGKSGLVPLYLLSAEAFLSADRPEQCIAALEKADALAPNAALQAYRLARVEEKRHQPAKGLELLDKYFEAKETDAALAPYQLLARLLADSNREAELIGRLEQLRQRDPQNQSIALFLAEQYRLAEQFDKAEPAFRAVIPNNQTASAYYQGLASVLYRQKKTEPLLELLGELAGQTGNLDLAGDALEMLADDKETVETLLRIAKEKHQSDADSLGYGARLAVALVALKAGQVDDAAEFFERAIKVSRENAKVVYRAWGGGLLNAKEYAAAARVLRRAIDERAVAGDDPTFHYFLSGALVLDDKKDEALEAAKHAASLNPRSIVLAARLAWVTYYAKRYDEAQAAYEDLLRRFDEAAKDESERQEMHNARMVLSSVAVVKHDLPAAEEWLSQVLDEFPDDIGAQNDLGYLWADRGKRLKTSLVMIERAVAAEPENAAYRDSLGWVLHRLGRHEAAVAELKKAAAGDSPDGVMLEHLGEACQAAGQTEAAKEAWQKALSAFEKEADQEKIERVKQKLAGAE